MVVSHHTGWSFGARGQSSRRGDASSVPFSGILLCFLPMSRLNRRISKGESHRIRPRMNTARQNCWRWDQDPPPQLLEKVLTPTIPTTRGRDVWAKQVKAWSPIDLSWQQDFVTRTDPQWQGHHENWHVMLAISTASTLSLFFLHRTKKKSDIATYQSKKFGARKSWEEVSRFLSGSTLFIYEGAQLPLIQNPNRLQRVGSCHDLRYVESSRSTSPHDLVCHEVKILLINSPVVHTCSNFRKKLRMRKASWPLPFRMQTAPRLPKPEDESFCSIPSP